MCVFSVIHCVGYLKTPLHENLIFENCPLNISFRIKISPVNTFFVISILGFPPCTLFLKCLLDRRDRENLMSAFSMFSFVQIHYPFMTKSFGNQGIERNLLNLIYGYEKLIQPTSLIFNESLNAFSLVSGTRQRYSLITSVKYYILEFLSYAIRQEKNDIQVSKKN